MTSDGSTPPWKDRLSTRLCWLLVLSITAFMSSSLFWTSRIPQYALLSICGEESDGSIVASETVHYASFPYDGVVHTVEYTTRAGEAREFELTGELIPSSLSGVFKVLYLPAWPAVVLPVEEPRLSPFTFACGCLVVLAFVLALALLPRTRKRNVFVRAAQRLGDAMLAPLERLWERLEIDHRA